MLPAPFPAAKDRPIWPVQVTSLQEDLAAGQSSGHGIAGLCSTPESQGRDAGHCKEVARVARQGRSLEASLRSWESRA